MNIDLFKYILKLSVIPMLFLSLLLITHGADDDISIINIIGFILLIISGSYIIVDAKIIKMNKVSKSTVLCC